MRRPLCFIKTEWHREKLKVAFLTHSKSTAGRMVQKKAAARGSASTRVMKMNTAYKPNDDISEQVGALTDTNESHYHPWALLFSGGQERSK